MLTKSVPRSALAETGKFGETVAPVTYAFPEESTAILREKSGSIPPR